MNLAEDLMQCQQVLYKGFTTVDESGIDWLNGFCGNLSKFCNKLHKFLIFDCNQKTTIIETCFLCMSQIICCVKYMERTIKIERTEGLVMSSTRQYFLDRILWCFARLKSAINSAKDDIIAINDSDTNFVTSMDSLVESIEPYSAYKKEDLSNVARFNAQAIFDSQKIRATVDLLLGQTLAFANVALDCDKTALAVICQKVLRECIAFQETCSPDRAGRKPDEHERQFKATIFENCLYQLEDLVNESLLRLIFQVMVESSQDSVECLGQLINANASNELDDKIADFDINVDRILQIGIFAMALSVDVKAKTAVRSCLASLESLDSTLIPSLYTKDDFHSTILEDHYLSEVRKFKNAIQTIVDTRAFCKCYEEMLSICIESVHKKFDKSAINVILEKGKILDEHFQINAAELISSNENRKHNETKECYEKFNLMLNECLAILTCADQVEKIRIFKRLKIFRSTVKKLMESIETKPEENVIFGESIVSKTLCSTNVQNNFSFESFGISPSVTCILYKSQRKRNNTASMKVITSQLPTLMECSSQNEYTSRAFCKFKTPKLKRKMSLRTQMFKRQQSTEDQNERAPINDQSTNLHITEILDQITNLSSTFSKIDK